MNKIQFLISLIIIIPFFGAFAVFLARKNHSFISKFSTILALIMIGNIINLCFNHDGNLNAISLITLHNKLDIGFSITNISLIIALIVTFIWFIITIYSNEYFIISNDKRFFAFKLFSILLVGIIILITFSKNLISLFLFYQLLIFCLYFLNTYFMKDKDFGASNFFTISLFASSFFMFLAMFLAYKTTGTTEFLNSGIFTKTLSYKRYFALLTLFILSIGSITIFPLHLFYKRLFCLNSPIIVVVLIMSYGLVSLLIMLKIILNIFGFEYFIQNTNNFNFSYILNTIIMLNLMVSAILVVAQNNIKKILIFLFFNQLIFAFFLFLILNQSIDQFIITIISFILSQTLIFLSLGNISLYLLNSKKRDLEGIFYKLKITSILLIFGLLNLVGLVPSIGFVEKFLLIQNYLIKDFDLNFIIIVINMILVLIGIVRTIYPILRQDSNYNKHDIKLAQKIDNNLFLIFPSIIVATLMFMSFVFSQGIINYTISKL